jgi:hypothetical protein
MVHTFLQILIVTVLSSLNARDSQDCFPIFSSSKDYQTFRQSNCQTSSEEAVKLKGVLSHNKLLYKEQAYAVKEVWGFMIGNVVYRAHESSLYRIIDHGPIVIYRGVMQRKHAVFFSTDLDAEIHWFSKNLLVRELKNINASSAALVENLPRNDLLAYFEDEDHFLVNLLLTMETK